MKKRVVVALSGGVDSSVAAYLLTQQNYEVIALFMRNWNDPNVTLEDECPWVEDSRDAMLVAEKLGIPFQTVDLSEEYRSRIVDYMFDEYEKGRTPNPDVLCNREIKFDVFLDVALRLNADYVATGHYCRKETEIGDSNKPIHRLLAGKDKNKDQSYFLCQLSQEQLGKALFPIGELQKSEVRKIARDHGLVTADKRDSQGLCFVGKVRLPDFLQQKLKPKEGDIIEIPKDYPLFKNTNRSFQNKRKELKYESSKWDFDEQSGKIIGQHRGAHYFTNGQRKGLQIGGYVEPLYVLQTDVEKNLIFVGEGNSHPGLYRKSLFIANEKIHWIRPDLKMPAGENRSFYVRIRYRQPLQKGTLYQMEDELFVQFDEPQSAITEGQFCAWYDGDECLGSGVICLLDRKKGDILHPV